MKKTLFTVLLCMTIAVTVFAGSLDGFVEKESYSNNFTDVPSDAWFYDDVKTSYNLGLMKGQSDDYFGANDSISVAESIALAARVCSMYNGEEIEQSSGDSWYNSYVIYAKSKGIVSNLKLDFDGEASRQFVAAMFYNSISSKEFEEINHIMSAIPDSDTWDSNARTRIYSLYEAGILTGNDEYGTFDAERSVSRAEVATIINRVVKPEKRKKLSLKAYEKYMVSVTTFGSVNPDAEYMGEFYGEKSVSYEYHNVNRDMISKYSELLSSQGFYFNEWNDIDSCVYAESDHYYLSIYLYADNSMSISFSPKH